MSLDLASVHNSCIANKLGFIPAKSSFLIIPSERNMQQPSIALNLNNFPLFPCNSVKCLDIYSTSINN